MNEQILDAIKRANKLGAKGIEVVDYVEPQSAMQSPELILIIQIPEMITASETVWYKK